MTWLFLGLGLWIALAIPAALLIGRALRVAENRRAAEAQARLAQENVVAPAAPLWAVPPPSTGPATVPPRHWPTLVRARARFDAWRGCGRPRRRRKRSPA